MTIDNEDDVRNPFVYKEQDLRVIKINKEPI